MTAPRWKTRLNANKQRQKLPEPNWLAIWVMGLVMAALMLAGLAADVSLKAPEAAMPFYIVGGLFALIVLVFRFYPRLFIWSPPAS